MKTREDYYCEVYDLKLGKYAQAALTTDWNRTGNEVPQSTIDGIAEAMKATDWQAVARRLERGTLPKLHTQLSDLERWAHVTARPWRKDIMVSAHSAAYEVADEIYRRRSWKELASIV